MRDTQELVLQVCRRPKKGVTQQFASNTANQSFHEGMSAFDEWSRAVVLDLAPDLSDLDKLIGHYQMDRCFLND